MRAAVLALALLALSACNGWDDPDPRATAPSPEYPCGVTGVPCTDEAGALTHTCCGQNETCGGGALSGCPAGQCCFVGPEPLGRRKDAGSASAPPEVVHAQTRAR